MGDVFNEFIPDFDWERFELWIEEIETTQDARLLLRAPLCTPAGPSPVVVKIPSVVGADMCVPEPKKDDKGKEELDGTIPTNGLAAELSEMSSKVTVDMPTGEPASTSGSSSYAGNAVEPVPVMVEVANSLVPQVDSNGRRVRPQEPKPEKLPEKADKPSKEGKSHTDPREWVKPKVRENETAEAFGARLKLWEKKRRQVAKRLGVLLPK